MPPATLYAALCSPAGEDLSGPRQPIPVNATTLPAYGQPGAILYAPLAWPWPGDNPLAPLAVRLYAADDPAVAWIALAYAAIPLAELPPSRALPQTGELFRLPGGALALTWA